MIWFSKIKLLSSRVIIIIIVIAIFIAFLAWLFIESSKPLPGQIIADLGRGHVPIGENVDYNSNPPTSGKHYEEWIRAGVYESEKDDRNLVHSLEHGYVILHYKCNSSVIPSESEGSQDLESEDSSPSAQNDVNEDCEERKNQLIQIYEKKGKRKLIVIPRSNLDTNFALTAWTYLDKFDNFDGDRIEKFIDTHRDQGPEQTME